MCNPLFPPLPDIVPCVLEKFDLPTTFMREVVRENSSTAADRGARNFGLWGRSHGPESHEGPAHTDGAALVTNPARTFRAAFLIDAILVGLIVAVYFWLR